MTNLLMHLTERFTALVAEERGAVGWMLVGIVLGVILIVFAIIKFLIPGD